MKLKKVSFFSFAVQDNIYIPTLELDEKISIDYSFKIFFFLKKCQLMNTKN